MRTVFSIWILIDLSDLLVRRKPFSSLGFQPVCPEIRRYSNNQIFEHCRGVERGVVGYGEGRGKGDGDMTDCKVVLVQMVNRTNLQ